MIACARASPARGAPPVRGAQASEDAAADYALCAAKLAHFSDYLVINVSSPNTPGARSPALARPCSH